MFDKPLVVNDWEKIEQAYKESLDSLGEKEGIRKDIALYLWAYHEAGQLIPQTIENVTSGHYFPYSTSYEVLESSYQLCLLGFYTNSMASLRSVLELGLLGVYFAVEDMEHVEVQDWLRSVDGTPFLRRMINRFPDIRYFNEFNERFNLTDRILAVYDELGDFVHTRGYFFSPQKHSMANFNTFREESLYRYVDYMRKVVADTTTLMLIKYLVGMVPLPLDRKFGFNGPAGGFLNEDQQEIVVSVVKPDEREYLEEVASKDTWVQGVVEQIEAMPDVTREELDRQWKEHEALLDSMDKESAGE